MDFLNESLNGILIGNVANVAVNVVDASLFVSSQALVNQVLIDIVEDDVFDTCASKSLGNIETDAIGSTCYPGIFALERKWILCHCHVFFVSLRCGSLCLQVSVVQTESKDPNLVPPKGCERTKS